MVIKNTYGKDCVVAVICIMFGEDISKSLPVFHAFSVCNTTSCFGGIGRNRALKTWESLSQAATTFFIYIKTHLKLLKFFETFPKLRKTNCCHV